jgi:hypothetical protein
MMGVSGKGQRRPRCFPMLTSMRSIRKTCNIEVNSELGDARMTDRLSRRTGFWMLVGRFRREHSEIKACFHHDSALS